MMRAIILDSVNQTLHNFKIQNVGQRGGGSQRDPRGAEEQREGERPGRETLLQTKGAKEAREGR